MKHIKFIFAITAISVLSAFTSTPANARDDARQAQLDSLATKLADRLENNGWAFVPDRFTCTNNVTVDFFSNETKSHNYENLKNCVSADFFSRRHCGVHTG